jgi:hypothetical protein
MMPLLLLTLLLLLLLLVATALPTCGPASISLPNTTSWCLILTFASVPSLKRLL